MRFTNVSFLLHRCCRLQPLKQLIKIAGSIISKKTSFPFQVSFSGLSVLIQGPRLTTRQWSCTLIKLCSFNKENLIHSGKKVDIYKDYVGKFEHNKIACNDNVTPYLCKYIQACCKPNWIFTQQFPFWLQQAYKVLKWVRISWNISMKMKRMRKNEFFGLAAKFLSDLVCNRPPVYTLAYTGPSSGSVFPISCDPDFLLQLFLKGLPCWLNRYL